MASPRLTIPFEAYSGSEPYLFVSYAHKDSQVVFPEISFLNGDGYRVWYDEGIDPGNEWPEMIAQALDGCSQFIVFVSPNAVNSQNVRNEIHFALNRNKSFLAVHIEETALPTGLELRMGDIQAILKYRMDTARYRRQLDRSLKHNIRALEKPRQSRQVPTDHFPDSQTTPTHPSLQPNPVIVNDHASPIRDDLAKDEQALRSLARRIATDGTDVALHESRFARFGTLDVVDPEEIADFLDLHRLIHEYQKQPQRVPLPVAVFSPPGEARIVCVQQVIDSIIPVGTETVVINMASLDRVDDLTTAFHRIREIASTGTMPLVFWNGFDCRNWAWLAYFVPAMEFGSYIDGKTTYQIGSAIFVFLSDRAASLDMFLSEPERNPGKEIMEFTSKGGPAFLSCLRGYLEVLGINAYQANDRLYPIRRAVWLRYCLRRRTPWLFRQTDSVQKLNIDTGVLDAFLNVRHYFSGVRSMEAIIGMSRLSGAPRFGAEALPSQSQLGLHTNGEEFMAYVNGTAVGGSSSGTVKI